MDGSEPENVLNRKILDFRNLINIGRLPFHKYFTSCGKWMLVCSSLDVIEDTASAITAYQAQETSTPPTGDLYLKLYGLLQAMFIQQNALTALGTCIGVNVQIEKHYPILNEIREVRHYVAGHPNSQAKQTFISRHCLNKAFFEFEVVEQGITVRQHMDTYNLILRQRVFVGAVLDELFTAFLELHDNISQVE